MLVREIAQMLGAEWEGDGEREISAVAPLDQAGAQDVAFVGNLAAAKTAASSQAGCLLTPLQYPPSDRTIVRVGEPRTAIAQVIARLHPRPKPVPGIHPTAEIAPGATLGKDVSIGAWVSIGPRTAIGAGTSIGAGCSIESDVQIGAGCTLHPRVTIYPGVSIGNRVILHSGVVLGADGFGFVMRQGAWENFPQIGGVEVGDDVEIGANACVDRAALGITSIGKGTKLDNMVHIGHNCRVGRHVVIAAQTGMAGGCVIEDYAVIGGQVGLGEKVHVESKAVIGSGAGILSSKIVRSGQVVWGTPARPLKQYLEQLAAMSRLPEMRREWRELKRRLADQCISRQD